MSDQELEFHEMGLDDRLLKAIAKLGWGKPTPIQEKAVPLILEGKDVLARARTGSGKTGGFCLPMIHRLMQYRVDQEPATRGIILAPTKELCGQIARCVSQLSGTWLRCVDVSGTTDLAIQRPLLAERPAIVVGTPSRILAHLKAGHLTLKLEMLVIDEADLVLSFGHEQDLNELLTRLPNRCQTVLTSATLSPELQEGEQDQQRLAQYVIRCEEDDKFALLCALFKLRLIVGKTLIFVTTVDRCFVVKLFLEQFGVRCCVLNSELPLASRALILNQFNEGRYEIMVASDEKGIEAQDKGPKKSKKRNQDPEYGVCRGLDFQNLLRHDKALHIIKHQPHLKHCPDYIIPPTLQRTLQKESARAPQPVKRTMTREEKNRKYGKKPRRNDPLQTFSCD
ncbi:hypothetical protein HPB50_002076 [Hyalomma asiaticum]|uniref:Uncharacterized protein n=1 Tax=Hyalomma asiaticum TaxID=266040 RepID=A0ACB7T4Y9_HYAAI|nr:hypothetical protein HPB50_002076 [Hyalomma asiaticum]